MSIPHSITLSRVLKGMRTPPSLSSTSKSQSMTSAPFTLGDGKGSRSCRAMRELGTQIPKMSRSCDLRPARRFAIWLCCGWYHCTMASLSRLSASLFTGIRTTAPCKHEVIVSKQRANCSNFKAKFDFCSISKQRANWSNNLKANFDLCSTKFPHCEGIAPPLPEQSAAGFSSYPGQRCSSLRQWWRIW